MRLRLKKTIFVPSGIILILIVVGLLYENYSTKRLHKKVRERLKSEKNEQLFKILQLVRNINDIEDQESLRQRVQLVRNSIEEQLGIHSDYPPISCGDDLPPEKKIVCDEVFLGSKNVQTRFESAWIMDPDCDVSPESWQQQVTLVLLPKESLDTELIKSRYLMSYPELKVLIVSEEELMIKSSQIKVTQTLNAWESEISTPYALIGHELHCLSSLAKLERGIRLLSGDPTLGAISGANRNLTGYWKTSCHQTSVRNYNLAVVSGYEESECDCMKCSFFQAPFLTRTQALLDIPIDHDLQTLESKILAWLLDLRKAGFTNLLCPDIMFLTYGSNPKLPSPQDWQSMAKKHRFQSVTLGHESKPEHVFLCEDVDLTCEPYKQQSSALILPWCCHQSYAYILKHLDRLASTYLFHYELDSGSALGAVKIGTFIPWDVDGDVYFSSENFSLLKGEVKDELEKVGISVYGFREDNYFDKGAGYFKLFYNGIEVEMLGKRGSLTMDRYPELRRIPTKIYVSGTWVRIHSNPGEYVRSRYGPGYLRHAQSWRYEDMENSFKQYKSGVAWKLCEDPSDHACLEHYPLDGNVLFNQDNFNQWKIKPSKN